MVCYFFQVPRVQGSLESWPGVTAPIVGTTSLDNLNGLLGMHMSLSFPSALNDLLCFIGAVNLTLSEEDIKSLDEPYQPKAVAGH